MKRDKVIPVITVHDPSVDPDKVIFKTRSGTEFKREKFDKTTGRYVLNLVGGNANDGQELYALYPKSGGGYYNLGKLLIVSYPSYRIKVKIVPVANDLDEFEALRGELEKIYSRVGIECVVEKMPVFAYSSPLLFADKSGVFSAYTDEMKKLQGAYVENYGIDPDASYLFVLLYSGQGDDRNYTGFMPLNKQFGYLFRRDFGSFEEFAVAAAHELAHGRLSLRHPFDKSLGLPEGSVADNLMDYRHGRELAKWQWDVIHDPGIVLRVFERDEDVMRRFNNFEAFKEIVSVYINNLLNWGIKEGYDICTTDAGVNLYNSSLDIYKPNQVSGNNISYVKKLNLMGMNEYSEEIEIEILSGIKLKMTIEFILSLNNDYNEIKSTEYLGFSASIIHGNPGYFFLFLGLNNRKIGTINFSNDDYDLFAKFLRYYKLKGFNIGLKDLMQNDVERAQQYEKWGIQEKEYYKGNEVVSSKYLIIKRVSSGETFKLYCER